MINDIACCIGISIGVFILVMPWICIFICERRIEDTMSIKEEQKIIKLFKKYGIDQTGSGMTQGDRYTELGGIIGNRGKEVRIEVRKEKFKIVFELEPDLSIQKDLGISSVIVRTIKNFNKVFKNGIIEYFDERIKMKKLENKLNRIEEDF
jgi:hypothetical protein